MTISIVIVVVVIVVAVVRCYSELILGKSVRKVGTLRMCRTVAHTYNVVMLEIVSTEKK